MAQLHQNATALSTNSKLRILVANMPELENVKAMHTDIKERLQSGWQPTDTQIVLLKKLIKGMLVEPNRLTFKGLSREIEASTGVFTTVYGANHSRFLIVRRI